MPGGRFGSSLGNAWVSPPVEVIGAGEMKHKHVYRMVEIRRNDAPY